MSLEQLQTVVAIAEEGAVVRAAKRLHISQPPLTRRLQALEEELGTPLFQRRPQGMRLTPAGEVFLAHARGILRAVDEARTALRQPVHVVSRRGSGEHGEACEDTSGVP